MLWKQKSTSGSYGLFHNYCEHITYIAKHNKAVSVLIHSGFFRNQLIWQTYMIKVISRISWRATNSFWSINDGWHLQLMALCWWNMLMQNICWRRILWMLVETKLLMYAGHGIVQKSKFWNPLTCILVSIALFRIHCNLWSAFYFDFKSGRFLNQCR